MGIEAREAAESDKAKTILEPQTSQVSQQDTQSLETAKPTSVSESKSETAKTQVEAQTSRTDEKVEPVSVSKPIEKKPEQPMEKADKSVEPHQDSAQTDVV